MRTWILAAVVVTAAAACHKDDKLQWNKHVLTQVEVGPFTFDIPPGWRDTTESANPQLARITGPLGDDAHMIVRENATNTDTTIAFMWSEATAGRFTCDQFVAAMGSSDIDHDSLTSENLGSDLLCSFHMTIDDSIGRLWVRLRDTKFLTLECGHLKSGDPTADVVCDQLVAAMRAQ